MPNFHSLMAAFLASKQAQPSYLGYCRLAEQQFINWTVTPTFAQLEDWHQNLSATPHQANKALAFLKAMFTWGIRRGLYAGHNPATGIKQLKTFPRHRFLEEEECQRVIDCFPRLNAKSHALLMVLLFTGARLSEALRMKPEHLDWRTGRWLQPHTKNGRPHLTYVATQTRALLHDFSHQPYLFAGDEEGQHWSVGGAEFAWKKIRQQQAVQLPDVRLHDFRRTFTTYLRRQVKDVDFVKHCINHANPSATSIYNVYTFQEVAAALQAQADRWLRASALPAPSDGPRSHNTSLQSQSQLPAALSPSPL